MANIPLNQREHNCFISYASEDQAIARGLAEWLALAGLDVWFDKTRFGAGEAVVDELTRQVCNSRACLFLLTSSAMKKKWLRHEVQIATDQEINEPGFRLVAIRTDSSIDPTAEFPALRKLSWIDVPDGGLTVETARRLLLSLTPGVPKAPMCRHVFVSCGWGEKEVALTRRVCAHLATRQVRLIGDATDQRRFGEDGRARIARIMSGCTGHLLILPERKPPGKTSEEAYKYFLAEWDIGRRLGHARRVLCVTRAVLPSALREEAIEIANGDGAALEAELVALHDETEAAAPYVFLATDFKIDSARNDAARDVIEHVLGMECRLGKDYPGEQLRDAIIQKVINANMVFADLACVRDEQTSRLRPNLNTCIEAGVALGARRPVFATALDPESFDPGVKDKTTQVPFMYRDSQIHWYRGPVEFLAQLHRLAMATRRRIINDEIQ